MQDFPKKTKQFMLPYKSNHQSLLMAHRKCVAVHLSAVTLPSACIVFFLLIVLCLGHFWAAVFGQWACSLHTITACG